MSFKTLNNSFKPLVSSVNFVEKTIVKSITQKNHTLKGDLIAILVIVLTLLFSVKVYNYLTKITEGNELINKSKKNYVEKKCNETDIKKVCSDITKKGKKKECIQYPCCVWSKYKSVSKCEPGSATGPTIRISDNKVEEYYYMGKKLKGK